MGTPSPPPRHTSHACPSPPAPQGSAASAIARQGCLRASVQTTWCLRGCVRPATAAAAASQVRARLQRNYVGSVPRGWLDEENACAWPAEPCALPPLPHLQACWSQGRTAAAAACMWGRGTPYLAPAAWAAAWACRRGTAGYRRGRGGTLSRRRACGASTQVGAAGGEARCGAGRQGNGVARPAALSALSPAPARRLQMTSSSRRGVCTQIWRSLGLGVALIPTTCLAEAGEPSERCLPRCCRGRPRQSQLSGCRQRAGSAEGAPVARVRPVAACGWRLRRAASRLSCRCSACADPAVLPSPPADLRAGPLMPATLLGFPSNPLRMRA